MAGIKDDTPLFILRRDFSGGMNSRQHDAVLGENQAHSLINVVIDTAGERSSRNGQTLLENLGTSAGTGLFAFEPDGGTTKLLAMESTKLWYATAFSASGFVTADTGFTTNLNTTFVKVLDADDADIVIISNGTDNVHQFKQDNTVADLGDDNNAPPKTTVLEYYRNRLWALDGNKLYYSDAISSAYASAFNRTSNYYNIPIGSERRLLGIRDTGLVVAGSEQIWGLNPSITPAPATDKPEKLLSIGVKAGNTMQQVGDDVWFLAADGVRGVVRTQQDNLQLGQSKPLSWKLEEEVNDINWNYVSKACAIYYDGKYFLSVPTGSSTYNDEVWVGHPDIRDEFGLPVWVVYSGWKIAAFAKISVNGQERLYGIDGTSGKVYRLLYGSDDNGTAITYTEEGREEDFGQPLVYKWGGEIEVNADALAAGNYLVVSVGHDGEAFEELGDMDLASLAAPYLPVALPFSLSDYYVVRRKYHLDSIGRFRTLQVKLESHSGNTDPIKIYGYSVVTFKEEYESE